MKKNLNKLATLALTGILMTGMSFGALAESVSLDDEGKASGAGETSLLFVKEVEVKDVDDTTKSGEVSAPDISFRYAVSTPSEDVNGSKTVTKDDKTKEYKYTIHKGVLVTNGNGIVTAPVVENANNGSTEKAADFNTNSTVTEVKDGDTVKYYVTRTDVKIDFSNVTFTDAGVYRYYITESDNKYGTTQNIGDEFEYSSSVSANTETQRAVDVFVSRQSDGELKITGYEMYLMKDGEVADEKTEGYTIVDERDNHNVTGGNVYSTYDMTVEKLVVGELAKAQYDFTVQFDKIPDGAKYLYTDASEEAGLVEAPSANFVSFTDTHSQNFKFADKGTIKIQGIPYEASATVKETDYASAGYKTTGEKDNNAVDTEHTVEWSVGTNGRVDDATDLVVTNTLEDIPITGVVMNIAPYAAMILGAGAFAGVFLGRKKSEDEE